MKAVTKIFLWDAIPVATVCGLLLIMSHWHSVRHLARYEQTVKDFLDFANELHNGHHATAPKFDAWGVKVAVSTNGLWTIYTSHGVNIDDPADDVILQIESGSTSYSISYTFGSRHFSSSVINE